MLRRLWWIALAVGCASESDEYVGSTDCTLIKDSTQDPLTHQACDQCQGASCGTVGCEIFPCVDETHLVLGCKADSDCSEFPGTRCGMHSAPDNVCSTHGDDI
jgi:hypothetical protein